MSTKPKVKLTDTDGNAFSIMARCARAAGEAGYNKEYISKLIKEMTSGDYDHLLQTVAENFEIE